MKTTKKVVRQPSAPKRTRRKAVQGVSAARLAISFDPKLARDVQRAAKRTKNGNVSAWLAEAAEEHLRHDALDDVIRMMEQTNGPADEQAVEKVRREWLG